MPLHLGDDPPGLVPGDSLVGEVMVENLWFLRGSSHGPCQEVVYLPVEVVVGLEPDGIEDRVIFQVLVDVWYREGGIPLR